MTAAAAKTETQSIRLSELADTCSYLGADLEQLGRHARAWAVLQAGLFFERLIAVEYKLRGWLASAKKAREGKEGALEPDRRFCEVPGAIGRTERHSAPTLGDMALACSDAGLFYEVSGGRSEIIAMGALLRKAAIFLDRLHGVMPSIRAALAPKVLPAYQPAGGDRAASA